MASYTPLNLDDCEKILALYGRSGVKTLTPMGHGISNTNYKVELNTAETYVLKISNDKNIQELEEEETILNNLKNAGYPYSLTPKMTVNGKWVYQFGKYHGVLFPHVQGAVETISPWVCKKVGSALGLLHRTNANVKGIRNYEKVGYSPKKILDYTQDPKSIQDFCEAFKNIGGPKMVKDWYEAGLETGIIHGDLYYDNTLFFAQTITAVLDFEQSGVGEFLFDLGISISGSCLTDGKIDHELVNEFIKGYESQRSLSKSEKKLLTTSIILGLFSISLWRIKRFTTGLIDPSKKESYKELITRAEQFKRTPYDSPGTNRNS